MLETQTIDFTQPVPLFPLPRCVLLPHASIPLHIFEPRYRQMTRDALESRGLIAMALFDGEDWKRQYHDAPPIREHVCVGYIARHDRMDDGRYHMLLQGLCRARLGRELAHEPYRVAMLEPTEPRPPMEIDLADIRWRLERLLDDPLLKGLACVSAIHNWLSHEIPTATLIDLATMTVCRDIEQRYGMLAEPDALIRAHRLEEIFEDTRRTVAIAERHRPPEHADHVYVN